MFILRLTLYLIPLLSSFLTMTTSQSEESCLQKNSYLWKVDTEPPLYLFGTMHVPYSRLWDDIPENAKVAFSSSDEVCLELRLSDPGTRQKLVDCQLLPRAIQSVEDVLSMETVNRIEQYFESVRGLFPEWLNQGSSLFGGVGSDAIFNAIVGNWKKKRPIWILMLISSLTEEQVYNRNIPVLDLFMDNVAEGLSKEVRAMESTKDHCRPLNQIPNEKVELALKVQLDYLEVQLAQNKLTGNQQDHIDTYRCGDFKKLVLTTPFLPLPPLDNITATSLNITPNETATLRSVEEELWNQMIVRRNRRLSNGIHALLQSQRNKTMFIALGAGHFLSDFNVLDRLRKKKYHIEHISVNTSIDGPTLPSNTIQLGDPSTRPRNLDYDEDESSSHNFPTLSTNAHDRIWNRFIKTQQTTEARATSQNHIAARRSPILTNSMLDQDISQGKYPTVENTHSSSGSQSGSNTHLSPKEQWSQEVIELLYPEQSMSGSNSILYSSQTVILLLIAVLALFNLC